ncbi:MAG: histidinol dehydrogenase [Edaphocola sp.]
MHTIIKPAKNTWQQWMKRPAVAASQLQSLVADIFEAIEKYGDEALLQFRARYDGTDETKALKIPKHAIAKATDLLGQELKEAILLAAANIRKFHEAQREAKNVVETMPGVHCWRESRAMDSVGLYIPGGSAPLFSTVLMLGIPANIAGCGNVQLCTPANGEGNINPAILYAASIAGITEIYAVGGIQAIAALGMGTATVKKVDKIFGPGNQYVTAAKQFALQSGTAIDMPAGPSEVLVIADEQAVPEFVAADLLSQAEHGGDSQVILLTTDEGLLAKTQEAITRQLQELPRGAIANAALQHSRFILLDTLDECFEFSNQYAPEHLILAMEHAGNYANKVRNAGSVFLGNYSCESAGDYASGTNHTLPTNGYARSYSGVSLDSFLKKITFQEISKEGLQNIGPAIEIMAEAEALAAHKNAVSIRLKQIPLEQ